MTAANSAIAHSLDVVRTVNQNIDVRREPFVIANADDVVVFGGWALSAQAGEPGMVYARVADTAIPGAPVSRDDVAAAHGQAFVLSGFTVAVAVAAFDASVLDVDLCLAIAGGTLVPFERRRIVVVAGGSISRSDAIQLDLLESTTDARPPDPDGVTLALGDKAGVRGWGYASGSGGDAYPAAAVVVAGRAFQAEYGLPRPDVFEQTRIGPDVGFYGQVPTMRFAPGDYDVRARLYAADGQALESTKSLQLRIAKR